MAKEFIQSPPNGDAVDGVNRAINFVACFFGRDNWGQVYEAGELCSDQKLPPDEWVRLIILAQRPESDPIYIEMKNRTDAVNNGQPLPRLPFVTLNGQPSFAIGNDFLEEVCAAYSVR